MGMTDLRRFAWAGAASLTLGASLVAAQKPDNDPKKDQDASKPKLSLSARPVISMAPSRVVLTAEVVGGPNDAEDYYCPSVEWDWGDGTQSESSADCPPYEAGKSEIKRRYTVEHVFRAGAYRVMLRLKHHDRTTASAAVNIQVRPGLRDGGH
ncbi:MAG TPA: hypothetical protein VFB07_09520 [Vicinamibacterales bacterium]|nr:hypothetical protein [Vicinamibacterales bacterium]